VTEQNNNEGVKYFSLLNPSFGFPDQLSGLIHSALDQTGAIPQREIRYSVGRVTSDDSYMGTLFSLE